jgi:site-specific DNA recombinase
MMAIMSETPRHARTFRHNYGPAALNEGPLGQRPGRTRLCSTARNKGTCDNRLTVRQDELEGPVIGALQSRLMDPALCAEFCEEYTRQRNALRGAKNAQLASAKTELTKLAKDRDRLIEAIKAGVPGAEVKDDLARTAARREELETLLATTKDDPVLLHPGMAEHYRRQVATLADALTADANRAEAADILRGLIDRIVLTPNEESKKLEIDLYGDLAGILGLAAKRNGPLDESDPSVRQVKMVAGVGFEPTTFRL